MVNPDNLALKIAELADSGKVQGIADVRDDTSGRTGQRLVVVLKRDAVARVVLNNLLKHTELQTNFSANMLALVDGVPRTLTIDQFISNWVAHQIEVIQRRTRYRLREAEEQAHILARPGQGARRARRGDRADPPLARRRRGPRRPDRAARHRRGPGQRDPRHAAAPAGGPRAAEDHRRAGRARAEIADLEDILANEPERQRQIVSDELAEIVDKYGDERRTQIIAADGDLSMEDLIPDEDLVVTITRGGYAKRTRADQYRTPEARRQGRARRDAARRRRGRALHRDHQPPLAAVLHHGRPGLPHQGLQPARGVARRQGRPRRRAAVSFQPDEQIAQVLAIRDYEQAPYLVLATRNGLVKKTRLGDYNSPRQAGVIAINFREDDDELIGAELVNADDDILLVSRKGQAIRFRADDAQLRPMGRATSGVTGMKFRDGDSLLSMSVIRAEQVAAEEAAEAEADRGRPRSRSSTSSRSPTAASPSAPGSPSTAPRPRRPRHQGDDADRRGPRRPGRRVHRRGGRRGAVDHPGRPGRAQPDRRQLPAHRRATMGVKFVDPQGGRRGRRRGPVGRGQGGRGGHSDDEGGDTPTWSRRASRRIRLVTARMSQSTSPCPTRQRPMMGRVTADDGAFRTAVEPAERRPTAAAPLQRRARQAAEPPQTAGADEAAAEAPTDVAAKRRRNRHRRAAPTTRPLGHRSPTGSSRS